MFNHLLKTPAILLCAMLFVSAVSRAETNDSDDKQKHSPLYSFDDEVESDDLSVTSDPLEPFNRVVFRFNQLFDGLVLKPLAIMVSAAVPEPGQKGLRNFIDNLFTPLSMVNYILQGDFEAFTISMFRFVINTVFGIGGLFDVAQEMGMEKKMTSMNETFTKWGVETGPYLVLPLLGPSSFRDAAGKAGDYFSNPLYILAHNPHRAHNHHQQQINLLRALYALDGVMVRTEYLNALNDIERSSLDFYVALRSVYFQKQKPFKAK